GNIESQLRYAGPLPLHSAFQAVDGHFAIARKRLLEPSVLVRYGAYDLVAVSFRPHDAEADVSEREDLGSAHHLGAGNELSKRLDLLSGAFLGRELDLGIDIDVTRVDAVAVLDQAERFVREVD